jgi:enoyl-CoA hydratase/carnithine racemase
MTDTLIIRTEGKSGFISLNRPAALHALNLEMCEGMTLRRSSSTIAKAAAFVRAAISVCWRKAAR